jgi:hypothetical protein
MWSVRKIFYLRRAVQVGSVRFSSVKFGSVRFRHPIFGCAVRKTRIAGFEGTDC